MAFALGIDLGTSAVKVALLDVATGECHASATSLGEIPRSSPHPGWVEQNPEDWWQAFLEALRLLPPESLREARAIGISYQMHGLVLTSEKSPVRPSIIWADGRAGDSGRQLASDLGLQVRNPLFNLPGNFTLAKLRWVREFEPEIFSQAKHAFLPGDWLAWRLSGQASTTATGFSEMVAWDFEENRPSDDAWRASAGDLKLRPNLVPALGYEGVVHRHAAHETGIPDGIPISYRSGDQPNNALSLNVLEPGDTAAVAGTSGVLYSLTREPVSDPLERVNTFLHPSESEENRKLGILMCLNGAGSLYSWTKQILGCSNFEELNQLASSAEPGANGVRFSPYGNGAERTLQGASPGAEILNIDFNRHHRSDLARAAMEGIVFAMNFGAEILASLGAPARRVRAGDSSMFRSELFRSIFSSVLDVPLEILDTDGALGAARAAAVGAGIYPSLKDAGSQAKVIARIEPDSELQKIYATTYDDWKERVHTAKLK
ncbi:FGGY family carbohydrate kinase [Kamptonema cortianum]|nr:FGGY family carbohydrate kinase [Geitlerinema splendidum]MDK3155342.1 FGGY family carbohydrate kinase [Kamptonema cortianum]